ncbi:hypothetical protein [Sphingomonas kyeonggiensis]|uniref:Uncharacterized protein n=1 Tax=Sphingomonas kyeonggiensis TaxID=1268553 RepID=A0A7W6JQZ3_9SPHN|nr:hypothetical protein [Sphingomonas kyeonggiensis]MBB4097900.1 hypothetical protein [Sphingomonas kyeonggiensis]
MSGKAFRPIDWQRTFWNTDGTRPWGRIAKAFVYLLVPQLLVIAAVIWALKGSFDIGPQATGLVIAEVLIFCCALFFVPEPGK